MVELGSGPALCRLSLRGAEAVARRAGAAFGAMPPLRAHGSAEAGPRAALWLGPDEWLLLAPQAEGMAIAGALAGALDGVAHSLVDVSYGACTLRLDGDGAERVLRAGCPLDLHDESFPPGMATRTVLGRIGVVLWRRGVEAWQIEVAPSLVAYARAFLGEAGRGG